MRTDLQLQTTRAAHLRSRSALLLALVVALFMPAQAWAEEDGEEPTGTFGGFELQQAVRDERPPMDPVGGFQLSLIGGVQLRGSASGQGGIAFGYFKRSTGNVGLELEAAVNRGPSGQVLHALASIVLQSGTRGSRMVPYLTFGGGIFHAKEKLRDAVAAELPSFGIDVVEGTETGPLIAVGFGFRYYLNPNLSFRADFREFRALTNAEGGFFDRLYAMRRIAGFLSIEL